MKRHKIAAVEPGSIAEEMELLAGDYLLSINGQEVKDILDYRWLAAEEYLLVEAEKPDGEVWELEIEKDSTDDLGLSFVPGTMGEDRLCHNACIFCFVDQQPPGLRESLYVKDDDPYQSFAVGNYITLTNLSSDEIAQVVKYRLSPMRVSVHAADMELRQRMMGSPKAVKLFEVLEQFSQAGIDMHFQAVLCKGVNDGPALDYTIQRLQELGQHAKSLAVVPVGLTRHREGLYPLAPFAKEDAAAVISQVEKWQARCQQEIGSRFVFLADEWYVLAGKPLPEYSEYEDFPQLDNGVGMMALFEEEFIRGINEGGNPSKPARVGVVTGQAASQFIAKLSRLFMKSFPDITIDIHVIANDFYGPGVTVSGLLTGQDIISQLKGRCQGLAVLFIPENAFRVGTEDMLCGTTLGEVSNALEVKAIIGSANGDEFCRQLICSADEGGMN